ncbi:MAG: CD1247 N-terminal domain-containing protein [Sarcina sp.]
MDNIRKSINELKFILKENKEINNDFNKKLVEVIENLSETIDEIQINLNNVAEDLSFINDDLSNVQEELFEEVTFEDLEDEDEYIEINCSTCNKPIFVENSVIKNKEKIACPYCTNQIN